MTDEISKHKQLVAEWEKAAQRLATLQQFSEAGGAQRVRISCEGNPEAEAIINDILESGSYQLMLNSLISRANFTVDQARAAVVGKAGAA